MIRGAILAALATSVPVAAQPAPVELWGGITYGTPGIEVHKRYPKHSISLSDACSAGISWKVGEGPTKPVQSLKLYGSTMTDKGCANLVREGLRSKYGEPVDATNVDPTSRSPANSTLAFQTSDLRVTFKSEQGRGYNYSWEVTYEPRANVAGAASKL